jgi:hypothetical protein
LFGYTAVSATSIVRLMDEPYTADELTNFRKFVEKLESGAVTLRRDKVDVTQRELRVLKREIADLEGVLERLKANAPL